MGVWVWGMGIGPKPQSPIPNPQSPIPIICNVNKIRKKLLINNLNSKNGF
jgi:hypothetical protein